MLDSDTIKKIEDLVYVKPRSIQEIAEHLDKNWRTADRYVDEIEQSFGTISTRVFRGGTRGALKIVFWASVDNISSTVFQQELEEQIMSAKHKDMFSSFDIFQHVPDKNKKAIVEHAIDEDSTNLTELEEVLKSAQKQVLFFSGNLSFINLKYKDTTMMKLLEELIKKGVAIKILCRVDITGKENIESVLALNFKHGKELIEIKHKEHPLRAIVVDNKVVRLKEVKEPTGKIKELDKKTYIFYTIKDKEWAEWMSKIFWKMFNSSIGAKKRLDEMKFLR